MLTIDRDINHPTSIYVSACSDTNGIYAVSLLPDFRTYDWNGKQTNTALSLPAAPSGIVLATAASAVISYNFGDVDIVDINTNDRKNITTGALSTYTNTSGQQIAASQTSKIAILTRNSAGTVTKCDVVAQTLSTLSPSSLSGTSSCVLYKPDTNTFLVGSTAGIVVEIDTSGNPLKTITLPTTPNFSTPTVVVTGLSYYNDHLAVVTNYGLMYFYQYSTSTINYILSSSEQTAGNPITTSLCDAASGTFLVARSTGSMNTETQISEIYMVSNHPTCQIYHNEAPTAPICVGLQPSLNKAFAIFFEGIGSRAQLRTFNISGLNIVNENTRSQDPLGVDVVARIIRLRDDGIGLACVEIDQNVSSGSQAVNCTQGHSYIEISYLSGSNKWDIREFST